MNCTGSRSAFSGGSNQMTRRAIPNVAGVMGIAFTTRGQSLDRWIRGLADDPGRSRAPRSPSGASLLPANHSGQRIRGALDDSCASEKPDSRLESAHIERAATEKIEVDRVPVAQMQSQRRVCVQHEVFGYLRQLGPQTHLCRWQDLQMRQEL